MGVFHLHAVHFDGRRSASAGCPRVLWGLALAGIFSMAQAQVLEPLVSTALGSHPSAQAYRALLGAAAADVDTARRQYYPTPSIAVESASTNASDSAYQGDKTVSTLRLQQPLWTGGRLDAGMAKAHAGALASQAALDEVRQQLALRVVQSYGDWLGSHLKTQAYERSTASHARLRDQVKRRVDLGLSSDSDLILATGRLESMTADLLQARAQNAVALARLGQLLGRPTESDALSAVIAASKPVGPDLQALLDAALATSPTVRKAQAQARVQESLIAERRADLSPEVYLRAEQQYGNHSIPNTGPQTRLGAGLEHALWCRLVEPVRHGECACAAPGRAGRGGCANP